LPFEKIFENGIIKLKNNSYVKIIKIIPINFNLKSNLEKEAILNSYKIFLKTCNFNIQILIQSNKEDLSKHILKIKNQIKEEKESIKILSNKYINFIQKTNKNKKSSSKNFYVLIKEFPENKKQKINDNLEKIIFDKLNDKYFNIKECLSRCGNVVIDISEKEMTEKILYSFLNSRKDLLEI
jgi:conjugal transfer ATP-binding protein TraC